MVIYTLTDVNKYNVDKLDLCSSEEIKLEKCFSYFY